MTEPDEACMKAAHNLLNSLETPVLGDINSAKEYRAAERADVITIARALMAEREKARAEERERCAEIVLERVPATQDMNPVTAALEDVYAIIKGEA